MKAPTGGGRPRLRARRPLVLLLAVVAMAAVGCATSGRAPVPRRATTAAPWVVPAFELGTQRLLRVRVTGEEGRGRFRLLLRLVDPGRYQIRATHPFFNRRLWSLDVDGDQALLVDYHQRVACHYQGAVEIEAIPMGPFPFESLPALLLGYLPRPPADEPQPAGPERVAFEDAEGRGWSATLARGRVVGWRVEQGGVTWSRQGDWALLRAPDKGLELRWTDTTIEPLRAAPRPLEAPPDYPEGSCDLGWLKGVEDGEWEDEPVAALTTQRSVYLQTNN